MSVTPQQSAATLLARKRREQAQDRERAVAIRCRLGDFARSQLPTGVRLWLIGSLAAEHFGERSDVDLVVDGIDSAGMGRLLRELEGICDAPVDLLRLEELAPDFRDRVLREGIRLDVA